MEQDLTLLRGEIVMTQNHFHSHEHISIIKPAYHVVVPKYQPIEYDSDWITWISSMSERLPSESIMFFGKNTKYLVDSLALFEGRSYYIKSGYSGALLNRAPVDITRNIMQVPTVLTHCLAIAIYMGFKEIYLLGFDLDQICKWNDRKKVRFYGFSPITANKAELDAEEEFAVSGKEWIYFWNIWHQCILLKKTAEARHCNIINATKGGMLNLFERKRYEDILRK